MVRHDSQKIDGKSLICVPGSGQLELSDVRSAIPGTSCVSLSYENT
jgi:hypothetical protein